MSKSENEEFFLKPKSQELFKENNKITNDEELNSYSDRQILEITNRRSKKKEIKKEKGDTDKKNEGIKEMKEEIIESSVD